MVELAVLSPYDEMGVQEDPSEVVVAAAAAETALLLQNISHHKVLGAIWVLLACRANRWVWLSILRHRDQGL